MHKISIVLVWPVKSVSITFSLFKSNSTQWKKQYLQTQVPTTETEPYTSDGSCYQLFTSPIFEHTKLMISVVLVYSYLVQTFSTLLVFLSPLFKIVPVYFFPAAYCSVGPANYMKLRLSLDSIRSSIKLKANHTYDF